MRRRKNFIRTLTIVIDQVENNITKVRVHIFLKEICLVDLYMHNHVHFCFVTILFRVDPCNLPCQQYTLGTVETPYLYIVR